MLQRLQRRLQAARQADGGFTLIELLIVIVILGVLAGVVIFSVNFISNRGETAACQTDVKNVQSAVEAYEASNTTYPGNMAALVPNFLRSMPKSDKYTIKYDPTTHLVWGDKGGTDCVSGDPVPGGAAAA